MRERLVRDAGLAAQWPDGLCIVNLRGRPDDDAFVEAASRALGVALPVEPCRTIEAAGRRVVWAGPDDWFVLDPTSPPEAVAGGLREAVAGLHAAVTDVSGGYALLRLAGPSARAALACGCPLDLHPRAFGVGRCAGSHYFKASVWLWQSEDRPAFEVLVRRSFKAYVQLMLARSAAEHGPDRGAAPPGARCGA